MQPNYVRISIVLMGFLYIFIIPDEPFIVKLLFKLLPMVLIIYYAFTQSSGKKTVTHWLILTGLFFSMIGDGTLHWFVVGLSAFLIGHLFYITGFVTQFKFSWLRFSIIVPLIAYGSFFANRMITHLQESGNGFLIMPVIFYIVAISCMALFASMTGNVWVIAGSLLFVLSDSILAWNKFVEPVLFSGPLIMITYYTAQFFIAHSLQSIVKKPYQTKDEQGLENIYYMNH